jgi:hypothetical protein
MQAKLRRTMEEEEAKQKARELEKDMDELRVRRQQSRELASETFALDTHA